MKKANKGRRTITSETAGESELGSWAYACEFKNWGEVAAALGVSKSTMSEMRRRRTLDTQLRLAMSALYHRHKPWSADDVCT